MLLTSIPVCLGAIGGLLYLVTERLRDGRDELEDLESRVNSLERRLEGN